MPFPALDPETFYGLKEVRYEDIPSDSDSSSDSDYDPEEEMCINKSDDECLGSKVTESASTSEVGEEISATAMKVPVWSTKYGMSPPLVF
ncbi:hypothetical protein HPB50_016996 [Hyalomma asiaticum]|uniref:Uncharacterized protein n=1 Tax=Hyalomma asiaticum TaxID=266040 RepID=A0ACB7S3P5_HYAAI|nr:hypothetical protein HPB50_016996 [Hyalomma asiaticum]